MRNILLNIYDSPNGKLFEKARAIVGGKYTLNETVYFDSYEKGCIFIEEIEKYPNKFLIIKK